MTPSFPSREPAPGVVVATDLRTAAGSPLPVEVTVTNTAAMPRVIAVGAIGVDAAWLPPITRTAVLAPGQSTVVTVTLSPVLGTVPAQYPLAFTAQSFDPETGRPSGAPAQVVDSVLVVNPRNQLALELSPRSASTVSSRRLRLTLRNTGENIARVRLGIQSSPKLRVRFRQQEIQVLPGATEQVRGRATVSRARFFGGVVHHTYTVTARGTEAVRHIEGSVTQRALVGSVLLKAVALLAVLSIWIAAAVIFIPQLADRMGDRQSETTTTSTEQDAPDGDAADSDDGKGGGDSGGAGKGDRGGTQQAADADGGGGAEADDDTVALSGTVTGENPGGVLVRLEPTSLVDEDAQRGVGVGVPSSQLGNTGMSLASAFLNRAVSRTPPKRTATTTADGSWAFADVRKPGYYLVTFSKLGYEPQSFVIDSTSESAVEPLEVDLVAGDGKLSGTVTGPDGKVGAATVTITDGANTITTSTNSRGNVGSWSVSGLATPGAYVVTAVKPGLSAESRMVNLGAGGTATADLKLRYGVASLVGKVRAIDEFGDLTGFGGAQVTVTSEDGEVRTATTLTGDARSVGRGRKAGNFVGSYTVPGLEVPGKYVVTYSGPGLQTQTSKVTFKKGQSRAVVDSDLTSASGTVAGRVVGGDGTPVIGAGLTLTNAENTYKTMSTSDPAGSYLFNGVAPGTYALSTQYFGFVTDHVTVTVRAGRTTEIDRQIEELEGGVLAGRSKVQGQVVDAGTGLAIKCPTEGSECLTASVFEPNLDTDGGDSDGGVDHSVTFLPGDTFTLPDGDVGLLPGLHTVTVTAPHYEVGSAKVQVPSDGTVNVGTIGLYPAPKINGTITTITGVPSGATCIWAVPVGDPAPTQDCASAAGQQCTHQVATFSPTATEPEPVCAFVDGRGSYSIEVLKHGSYDVYVEPSDPNYIAPDPTRKVLGIGDTQNYSVPMHRLGILIINARKPGTSGSLVAAGGVDVTVDPHGPGETLTGKTNGAGQLVFTGLADDSYDLTASSGGLSDVREDVPVGLDQEVPVELTLTAPVGNVVGQVTANIDGAPAAVSGAAVELTAPTSYATGTTLPITGTATMTTDDRGCFAVQPDPADVPDVELPSAGVCVPDWDADALEQLTFRSTAASSIRITADGYQDLVVGNRQLVVDGLNSFTLEPKPIEDVQLQVRTDPLTSGIDWGTVHFVVTLNGGGDFVSATATNNPSTPGSTTLNWNDRRLPAGTARPGKYTVTATAVGYQPATGHVTCTVETSSCSWDDGPLTLVKQGGLTISAVDDLGDVDGAEFTLMRGDSVLETAIADSDENVVTFTGLAPSVTDYKVRIRAAGHSFGFVGGGGEVLSSTCGATLTIPAGQQLVCEATLPRLNKVSGVVQGITNVEGASEPFRLLARAEVEIVRCTEVERVGGTDYCASIDADESFTATTNDAGAFTLNGTVRKEGIKDGDWLLRATSNGFHMAAVPSGHLRGLLIEDLDSDLTGQVMQLYVDLTDVTVSVTDQVGPVSGATVTMTGGGFQHTGTPVPDQPGSYFFDDIVPRNYSIDVSKAGYIGTGRSITFPEGEPTNTVALQIVRGSNNAGGTVADGIEGVAVRVCATEDCADGAVDGTDGQPLTAQTSSTGAFLFKTVPNGEYWVQFKKHGYLTQALGPYTFDFNFAGITNINPTLVGVTRNVEITLNPSWSNDDLSAATVTLSRSGSDPLTSSAVGDDRVAEFNQVPWGCWQVEVTLPADHYGDIGSLEDTGPADDQVGSCSTGLVVSGDEEEEDPAEGAIDVDEGAVGLLVAKNAVSGFDTADDPTSVTMTVAGDDSGPTIGPLSGTVDAAVKVVWLPPGEYDITVAPATADPFWPAVSKEVTIPEAKPSDETHVEAKLTLVEKSATLEVTVGGIVDDDPATAELTLYADGDGAVLPTTYTSVVETDTDFTYTFTLPKGSWKVVADVAGRTEEGRKQITSPTGHTLQITVPPPPEPEPTTDPDPTDDPDPTGTPNPGGGGGGSGG